MKKYIVLVISVFFLSCNNEPTLQKYFVENSQSADFISVDVGSSIINTEKMTLSEEDKKALKSFEKMNILAFKRDSLNEEKYKTETKKVKDLLKQDTYQQLMKMGSGSDGGALYFVGDENNIDEFVLYANKKENGFAVVRILGDNMDPSQILNLMNVIQRSDIDLEQFKQLKGLMN
jgi:hypothetical protein